MVLVVGFLHTAIYHNRSCGGRANSDRRKCNSQDLAWARVDFSGAGARGRTAGALPDV